METAFEYLDDRRMRCSTDERRMITRLLKLADQHPDEVKIIRRPENNDGCLYMVCPADWLLIRYPKQMNYTDEQLAALRERGKRMSEMQQSRKETSQGTNETEDDTEDA